MFISVGIYLWVFKMNIRWNLRLLYLLGAIFGNGNLHCVTMEHQAYFAIILNQDNMEVLKILVSIWIVWDYTKSWRLILQEFWDYYEPYCLLYVRFDTLGILMNSLTQNIMTTQFFSFVHKIKSLQIWNHVLIQVYR